jgi:hypothetical protein
MTRSVLAAVLALLLLAPAAKAETAATDDPREPGLPASQDFSHVSTTIDPSTGTWSVAYTLYGAPSSDAWGNLNAQLYTGASRCADFGAEIASFQESPTIPGDKTVYGGVIPPAEGRMVRAAQTLTKSFDGTTITLSMTDSSLVDAPATCVTAGISHRGILDQAGPLVFPSAPPPSSGPALKVALKSTRLKASRKGVVKVALKPFAQAVTGAVTLRRGGKKLGRASFKAPSGKAVTVAVKLNKAARRALERHRSLPVTVTATATATAGTQQTTRTIRARLRRG